MEKWSKETLFDEWWNLVSGDMSSAIKDKILLSEHFDLPVHGFGETPGVTFDPMGAPEYKTEPSEAFIAYRLLEEVFTRLSVFPSENMGRYIGINPNVYHRAYVQWSLMVMYNLGFRAALDAVKRMESK
jgi:hypothetical protein